MSRKFYLAYGSNLNVEQMKYRCPGAVMIGKTYLEDYRITFRGNSRSGVANIEPRKGSRVPVGIWSITQTDEKALDRYEGFPFQNGWVEVKAASWPEAHKKFRALYPDRSPNIINCAFFYEEERWAEMDPSNNWPGYRCYGIIE